MGINFRTGFKNTFDREILQNNGRRITYFQFIGLILIALGLIYFIVHLICGTSLSLAPDGIAIAFFITMLGVAFAFPDLLKGQTKELSTMRIIVFMFANVICMLLLKIGWEKDSLEHIGLDSYWVGIVAFLFGAKAAQKYFENLKSSPQASGNNSSIQKEVSISKIAIAQIAKVQNEEKLTEQFPNIEYVSDTVKNGESCLTIYVKDNQINDIPASVEVELNEGHKYNVKTEIVSDIGENIPQYAQLNNNIAMTETESYIGSICCFIKSNINPNFKGVVTSGHIFTRGSFIDYDGFADHNEAPKAISNDHPIGKLHFQVMNSNQDLAIVELDRNSNLDENFRSFSNGIYNVSNTDLTNDSETPDVTILSINGNKRDAYLLDKNVSLFLSYNGHRVIMRNIILIGSDSDKNRSQTVSKKGDSGSCVYHIKTNKLIGMLLGGNNKTSFVLPLEKTLTNNNFKII